MVKSRVCLLGEHLIVKRKASRLLRLFLLKKIIPNKNEWLLVRRKGADNVRDNTNFAFCTDPTATLKSVPFALKPSGGPRTRWIATTRSTGGA
jgi:hypothetical protein